MQSVEEYAEFLRRSGVDVRKASDQEILWVLEQRAGCSPELARAVVRAIK